MNVEWTIFETELGILSKYPTSNMTIWRRMASRVRVNRICAICLRDSAKRLVPVTDAKSRLTSPSSLLPSPSPPPVKSTFKGQQEKKVLKSHTKFIV